MGRHKKETFKGMDSIDSRQQREIYELQKKDESHDKDLWWMRHALKFTLFSFTLWVIISSSLIFVLINKLDTIPK